MASYCSSSASRRSARSRRQRFRPTDAQTESQLDLQEPSQEPNRYNFLYTKDHQAHLLNFIDFLSEEIREDSNIQLVPEFPLVKAKLIGSGESMEVYATEWNGERVAVKRMNRAQRPIRNPNIPLQRDIAYLQERNAFYSRTSNIIQEILITCRAPMNTHRNIVRLLALSWDEIDMDCQNTELFAPLLITELAHDSTPTLQSYYQGCQNDNTWFAARELLADIADGVAVLHTCGITHGDLKPENILLFADQQAKSGLVAKVGDFGFADTYGTRKGRTRCWAAPECLDGCPQNIVYASELIPSAADIYSFGLVALFVALHGKLPAHVMGLSDEAFDDLRFCATATDAFQDLVRPCLDARRRDGQAPVEQIPALLSETLCADPSRRVPTLGHVRLLITGEDRFQHQKRIDRYRLRPYRHALGSLANPGNAFTKMKTPFSNYVLGSLPPKIKEALVSILGGKHDFNEPSAHTRRRMELRKKMLGYPVEGGIDDFLAPSISLEDIYWGYSNTMGQLELFGPMVTGQRFNKSASEDFLRLDYQDRPPIFTWIEVDNVGQVQQILQADPEQAHRIIPVGGWSPIHLAACLGRVQVIRLLVEDYGVNPNVRAGESGCSPLHQAAGARCVAGVNVLLDLGAHIDALSSQGPLLFTALEQAVGAAVAQFPGDKGSNICFTALQNIELLKLIFDAVGVEDTRQLIQVVNSEGETLLHLAARNGYVAVVQHLLDLGANPAARDIAGVTPYAKLKLVESAGNTAAIAMLRIMSQRLSNGALFDSTSWTRILSMLEDQGPEATVLDDYSNTAEEARRTHANFKASSTREMHKARLARLLYMKFSAYDAARNAHYRDKLLSVIDRYGPFKPLCDSLTTWWPAIRSGDLQSDQLPHLWSEFFAEIDGVTGGFFSKIVKEDDIPEVCQLLKWALLKACHWAMNTHNAEAILQLMQLVFEEAQRTGLVDNILGHASTIQELFFLQSTPWGFWPTPTLTVPKLRKFWKLVNRGEVLDLSHQLVVLTGHDRLIDSMVKAAGIKRLQQTMRTPPSALWDVGLPQKCPGSTVFITRMDGETGVFGNARCFLQLLVFVWPAFVLLVSPYVLFLELAAHNEITVSFSVMWAYYYRAAGWKLWDRDFNLNPNIYRGLHAARELILFRLRYPLAQEEPVIIAIEAQKPGLVSIPERLKLIGTNTIYSIWWLPMTPDPTASGIPCYSAMGEVIQLWRDGGLPRSAWGYGWWELEDETTGSWKRVDVHASPSWSEFSEASNTIKTMLKDCPNTYEEFLSIRDYGLDLPVDQLLKMHGLLGDKHPECFRVWQDLFVAENSTVAPRSEYEAPQWASILIKAFGLHFLKDSVIFGLDEEDHLALMRKWGWNVICSIFFISLVALLYHF